MPRLHGWRPGSPMPPARPPALSSSLMARSDQGRARIGGGDEIAEAGEGGVGFLAFGGDEIDELGGGALARMSLSRKLPKSLEIAGFHGKTSEAG